MQNFLRILTLTSLVTLTLVSSAFAEETVIATGASEQQIEIVTREILATTLDQLLGVNSEPTQPWLAEGLAEDMSLAADPLISPLASRYIGRCNQSCAVCSSSIGCPLDDDGTYQVCMRACP